jgi:hypothetical protein
MVGMKGYYMGWSAATPRDGELRVKSGKLKVKN